MAPVDGTGFTPGAAVPSGAQQAQGQGQGQEAPVIDATQGLAALKKQFGDSYGDPIVTADGRVYMRRRDPAVKDGHISISYVLVGKISGQKLMLNPDFLNQEKAKESGKDRTVVKQGDQYYWQQTQQGEDGKLIAQLTPMTQDELQAYAQQVQQQEQQQGLQQYAQDKGDWINKSYGISSNMRLIATGGSFIDGLSRGPDMLTGKVTGANWMTGWFTLQMLDSKAGGKLLPEWTKQGPVSEAINWGIQIPFLFGMGDDLRVLGQAFPRTAALMKAFTAPTRAVLSGVTSIGKDVAAKTLPASAAAAAGEAVAAQGAAAAAAPSLMQEAESGLAKALRAGEMAVVGAPGTALADKVAVMGQNGALQLVPKSALYEGMKITETVAGGAKVSQVMNNSIHGLLGSIRPFLQPLQMGAALFGAVGGAMNLQVQVKTQGAKSLIDTKQGRSVLFGFLGSAAFLGMMLLPAVAPQLGAAAATVSAGMNVASNIFQGVSMLSYSGLFGEGGYLDHDAVRAAFLIPPLTPIGLAALWMSRKEKAAAAKKKAEEAQQQQAAANLQNYLQQSAQSLQQSGNVTGGAQQADGSIVVTTPFGPDGSMIGQPASSGDGSQGAAQGASQPQAQAQPQGQPPANSGRTLNMLSQRTH